jgi:hypothetical protein
MKIDQQTNRLFSESYNWSAEIALLDRLQSKLCTPDTTVLYEEWIEPLVQQRE